MKKIFLTTSYFILAFSILGQINIPTNSSENTRVSNWIVAKVSDFQDEKIENILNNPLDFYNNVPSGNLKELNLSDYNDVTIALYQLYKEIDYKTTFISTCEIELNNDQLCGFEFSNISMDATLFINSEKAFSSRGKRIINFEKNLKKGKNKILLIGKPTGEFLSSFFLKYYLL